MQPISPEEIELLTNPLARPAWFAKHHVPNGQPLEIKGRLLGSQRGLLPNKDIKDGRIGTWRFVNARLAGSLNLSDTTIQRIDNQGLTQNAKITGKLEASPDAPAPELLPPAVPAKGSKKP